MFDQKIKTYWKYHQDLISILLLFIGWRIFLYLISYYGISIIPYFSTDNNLYWPTQDLAYFDKWANWDGRHFLSIVQNGYLNYQSVFFPLYPLLIKGFSTITFIPPLYSALIISHLSLLTALIYFYKLIQIDYPKVVAQRAVFLLLIFPTSFYLGAVYSESLFLALTISAIYYARTGKYLLSFLLGGFSAVTRVVGVVTILAILIEYLLKKNTLQISFQSLQKILYQFFLSIGLAIILNFLLTLSLPNLLIVTLVLAKGFSLILLITCFISLTILLGYYLIKNLNFKKITLSTWGYGLISLIPFVCYLFFLQHTQNNFFSFIASESQWGRSFSFPWDTPMNYLNTLSTISFIQIGKPALSLVELLFFFISFIGLIFAFAKLRISYACYYFLNFMIPLSTGTLIAIHRFDLVIFPLFILLALIKNELKYQLWIMFSLLMLAVFTILFINGYWVS